MIYGDPSQLSEGSSLVEKITKKYDMGVGLKVGHFITYAFLAFGYWNLSGASILYFSNSDFSGISWLWKFLGSFYFGMVPVGMTCIIIGVVYSIYSCCFKQQLEDMIYTSGYKDNTWCLLQHSVIILTLTLIFWFLLGAGISFYFTDYLNDSLGTKIGKTILFGSGPTFLVMILTLLVLFCCCCSCMCFENLLHSRSVQNFKQKFENDPYHTDI
jgi:hypothetical protein